MTPPIQPLLAVVTVILVMFVFLFIFLSRYTKVGPNQVLIVSGRKIHLPDGRVVGYRIVKGGGTFVFPVIEKADTLSLEVISIEMPRTYAQAAGGRAVQANCLGQVKVNGNDASIVAAAEHFLNKSPADIKEIVRPVLEKHLNSVLMSSSTDDVIQNPTACAARVQTSASADLGQMGLNLISFTIRDSRTA